MAFQGKSTIGGDFTDKGAKMVINKTINPRLGMKLGRGISKIPS